MENASAAFLEAVRGALGPIRRALSAGVVDAALLSAAERLQYEGYLRRREESGAIRALAGAGTPIKEIVRRTGRSRRLVRAVLRNARDEVFRGRASSLGPWLVPLETARSGGCRNGAELWRRLRGDGFGGSLRVVGERATRRRRSERADGAVASRLPPTRAIARTMLTNRDRLTRSEAVMVTAVETALPALGAARGLVDRFHRMLQTRAPDALPTWIADATASVLAPFGRGIAGDQAAAVRAALTEPWSNGPTKGQITRLKLLRRQMYGRGKLDLLRARLTASARSDPRARNPRQRPYSTPKHTSFCSVVQRRRRCTTLITSPRGPSGNAHTPTRKGGNRQPRHPSAAQVSRPAPRAARQTTDDGYLGGSS